MLFALIGADFSAVGQTNSLYYWRNLTGQPGGVGDANGNGSVARFFNPNGVAMDNAGNIYVADSGNNVIRKISSSGLVTTLAGSPGQAGSDDGTNTSARFSYPSGLAVGNNGHIYVADTYNSTIREITSDGVVTTLADDSDQSGSTDGTNGEALFSYPRGVTVDATDNVYVADSGNNTIRKITSSGVVSTLAGLPGVSGSVDGTNASALFYYPTGMAVDSLGNVYVADLNNDTIRKITGAGVVVTIAGLSGSPGNIDGSTNEALFNNPAGLTMDTAGNVYVADTDNSTIREIITNGTVTTVAGIAGLIGNQDGNGNIATFDYPSAVVFSHDGRILVADTDNNTIRQITTNGIVMTIAGSPESAGSNDVTGSGARFNFPLGVAANAAGNVFVADTDNNTIRRVSPHGVVTTLAGSPGLAGSADGTNTAARFNRPSGITLDGMGNLYVADSGNNTIRKVTSGGVAITLAGSPGLVGSSDGTNGFARFNNPVGIAVNGAGDLYVIDSNNDTLRKVSSLGIVTTLAGTAGISGNVDGTNSSARFNSPSTLALDGSGIIYITDTGNKTIRQVLPTGKVTTVSSIETGTNIPVQISFPFGVIIDNTGDLYVSDTSQGTILKIATNGVVTLVAGSAGNFGATDGIGPAARFFAPTGMTIEQSGNIYVADSGNSTIRKISGGGSVTTLAGSPQQTGTANDIPNEARYFIPGGVAVDSGGNVYVADTGNSTIRKVTTDGGVMTLAGSPGQVGSSDGTNNVARFNHPYGLAVDKVGNIYVADTYNSIIRKVTQDGVVTTLAGTPGQFGDTDGPSNTASFNYPTALALDMTGTIYVADSGNDSIRRVAGNAMVTTLTSNGGGSLSLNLPNGVAIDSHGTVFVADSGNNLIKMISSSGVMTILAGSGGKPGSNDGTGGAALFNFPRAIALDGSGNIFVADSGNNTIRKVSATGVVTTLGGTAGVSGGADGFGLSANFSEPSGIALDSSGCIYVADPGNDRISKGTPVPFLKIVRTANSAIVAWPASFAQFSLQQNIDLTDTNGWSTSTNTISNDGTNETAIISPMSGTQFFRLFSN